MRSKSLKKRLLVIKTPRDQNWQPSPVVLKRSALRIPLHSSWEPEAGAYAGHIRQHVLIRNEDGVILTHD